MNIKETINKNFRGNIYVIRDGEVICEHSSGFADLVNEIPNTTDTRFASASAGKVFVAVGILRLIEDGRLRLDDTLGGLLDIDLHEIDRDITVEQLLTHTSGVPDYFDESVMDEYEELWTDFPNYMIRHNRDLLPLFIDKPMMYPRGERFQYNNTGFVLLAMIIERLTGVEFDEYLKEAVFDVCEMNSTGYFELDRLPSRCANNYIYCPGTKDYRTNIFSVDAKGTGAGGAFITVKDAAAFWKGLIGGKLLSPEMTAQMLERHSGSGDEMYGYGIWILRGGQGMDHPYFEGCDPGVSFISEYDPNSRTVSVLVSNYGDDVWAEIHKLREVLKND